MTPTPNRGNCTDRHQNPVYPTYAYETHNVENVERVNVIHMQMQWA